MIVRITTRTACEVDVASVALTAGNALRAVLSLSDAALVVTVSVDASADRDVEFVMIKLSPVRAINAVNERFISVSPLYQNPLKAERGDCHWQ